MTIAIATSLSLSDSESALWTMLCEAANQDETLFPRLQAVCAAELAEYRAAMALGDDAPLRDYRQQVARMLLVRAEMLAWRRPR